MTNVATDIALSEVVNALIAGDTLKWIGWGGGTGQGEADNDLASPLAEPRVDGDAVAVTTNTAGDTYRLTGTVVAVADRVVSEVGVFADPAVAELAIYGDFPPMNIASGDSIAFTIDVVIDQAA